MATALKDRKEEATDIIATVEANPVTVLTDRQTFNRFYEEMKRETDALDADVSADKGRKAIASMAYKVARTKTAIDDAGKKLNEEWRSRINAVDEARREIRQQLDQLKDDVRRPLTEWEEREDARKERCTKMVAALQSASTVAFGETAEDVAERRRNIEALIIDDVEHEGFVDQLTALRQQALDALEAAIARLEQEERDRAELERLRKEQEERAAREAEEARKREEEEARKRVEERRQREIAEAEERARQEADDRARAEERRAAEEKLAEERRQREAAEREAAEARRKEQERLAWEQKERREREKREADERHRKAVIAEIAEDLAHEMGAETDNRHALSLALATALAANLIRNVTVNF